MTVTGVRPGYTFTSIPRLEREAGQAKLVIAFRATVAQQLVLWGWCVSKQSPKGTHEQL
jgi:hypothetical protein